MVPLHSPWTCTLWYCVLKMMNNIINCYLNMCVSRLSFCQWTVSLYIFFPTLFCSSVCKHSSLTIMWFKLLLHTRTELHTKETNIRNEEKKKQVPIQPYNYSVLFLKALSSLDNTENEFHLFSCTAVIMFLLICSFKEFISKTRLDVGYTVQPDVQKEARNCWCLFIS